MKNIRLRFLGLGYLDSFQADIVIYDSCNNIVYDGKTFNGEVVLNLNIGKAYRAFVSICNINMIIIFYVGCSDSYTFNVFNNNVTFILTDYYYDNLPIERGELWLKT